MNQNKKQRIVELLCSSEPENIALAEAFCDSQNFPLETILREFGYWDVGIRCAGDFIKDTLNCGDMGLKKLPDILPLSLIWLYCHRNKLTILPVLPPRLEFLNCGHNQLKRLPLMPEGITNLICIHNELTELPTLPKNLIRLHCQDNQLTILPVLPKKLAILYYCNNQLTTLPTFPKSLKCLYYGNNPIRPTIDQLKELILQGCEFHS